MFKELQGVKRALPVLGIQFQTGQTVLESFFSGDAAGSALIATTQYLASNNIWWFSLPILTALGRMYIHAHHALDVTVGVMFGTAFGFICNTIVPFRTAVFKHFWISIFVFIAWQVLLRRFKPAMPLEYKRSWQGPSGAHDS